jgi:hypothetical protein
MRSPLCCVGGAILALSAFTFSLGQDSTPKPAAVSVPFVGCPSDGQAGPQKAPTGKNPILSIPVEAAERLAYYKAGGTSVFSHRAAGTVLEPTDPAASRCL